MSELDEMIMLDSPFAKSVGFTSDKFSGWGWIRGHSFYISFIESKDEGKGNLRAMIDSLLTQGFTVKVPTPFARMRHILERLEFVETVETDPEMGLCDVWVKQPAVPVKDGA